MLLSLQVRSPERIAFARNTLYRATEPLAGGTARVVSPPLSFLGRLARLRSLAEENDRLEKELWDLTVRARTLEEAGRQNQRLLALLKLREELPWEAIGARVLGEVRSESQHLLLLDAGSRDGIAPGMPVLGIDGLVGRVFQVAPSTSKVLSVTDPMSGVAVLFRRTRDQTQAVASGGGSGRLRIKYVHSLADVQAGDEILTSGLDGNYPKGIPVGTVRSVTDRADMTKQIDADPSVATARLEEVLVVRRPPEGAPSLPETRETDARP